MSEQTRPIAVVSATVSILRGGGPLPVDSEGIVYSGVHMDIEAVERIVGLSITEFELSDSDGVITGGRPSAQLSEVTSTNAVVGPFSGDISSDAHVRLWVSMRLEASFTALTKRPPSRFRLVVTTRDGKAITAMGEVDAHAGILA